MCVPEHVQLRDSRNPEGSEVHRSADTSDMGDGEAGAEPQGFQLDGASNEKLFVCPLWMVLAGPSYSHHCYHLTSSGIN